MLEAWKRYGAWVFPLMVYLYFTRNAYGSCVMVGGGARCFDWDVTLVGALGALGFLALAWHLIWTSR